MCVAWWDARWLQMTLTENQTALYFFAPFMRCVAISICFMPVSTLAAQELNSERGVFFNGLLCKNMNEQTCKKNLCPTQITSRSI